MSPVNNTIFLELRDLGEVVENPDVLLRWKFSEWACFIEYAYSSSQVDGTPLPTLKNFDEEPKTKAEWADLAERLEKVEIAVSALRDQVANRLKEAQA